MDNFQKIDGSITIDSFLDRLSSNAPVPGGGGSAALVSAIGSALCSMTCALTFGKKKYSDVEEDLIAVNNRAKELTETFIDLINEDAEGFFPLSKAYGLPAETEEEKAYKEKVLEKEYKNACEVPFKIMGCCEEAIDLCIEAASKGSKLVVSDAAAAVILLEAALKSASLNVYINTKCMKNKELAEEYILRADTMTAECSAKCSEVTEKIINSLKN